MVERVPDPKQPKKRRPSRALRLQQVIDYLLQNGPFVEANKASRDLGISKRRWEIYKSDAYDIFKRESRLDNEGVDRIRSQILMMFSDLYAKEKTTTGKINILKEIAKICGVYAPRKIEFTSANVILSENVKQILENDDKLEAAMQQDEWILPDATTPGNTARTVSEAISDAGENGGGDD